MSCHVTQGTLSTDVRAMRAKEKRTGPERNESEERNAKGESMIMKSEERYESKESGEGEENGERKESMESKESKEQDESKKSMVRIVERARRARCAWKIGLKKTLRARKAKRAKRALNKALAKDTPTPLLSYVIDFSTIPECN